MILVLLTFSCAKREVPFVSFYYWKTIFKLSEVEKATLKNNDVQKIYVRYFDIDLDSKKQAFPLSPIHFETEIDGYTIVPVIYVKNKVMLNNELNVQELAKKTFDYLQQINNKNKIEVQEIQIDCDWTLASRDSYLKFIESFKRISGKTLSATIRLHQIKYYTKTKIPNVSRGVLMYYNMGTIAVDSLNSIYDRNIANRYIQSLQNYPLEIDIALPIYSWAIHSRDGRVIGLRSKINVGDFKKDSNFVYQQNKYFKVMHSNYKKGTFYKSNDILKLESISQKDLFEMASDLKSNLKQSPKEIIFYDLDEINIKNYEKDIFKQVTTRF
ncbi:hypothetical protein FLWE109334_01195 [Flavobacterium weaverense]|uniref:Uncharacterized protein n=1 Tax=Flavobacterium weaverense TaxID=271156 RepID=A0A3L9ZXN7_9FLAO|nr:hypothetical protein BC961_1171 [Flavobacterium weaverense]